jgi:tRNA A37 threonylcarbamoyladenosine synthetase subunit TsaC/SUA5/YrdC
MDRPASQRAHEAGTRHGSEAPARRVPADLVLELLRQEGRPITGSSLRNWTRRGHVTRTADGYDLDAVLDYLERRQTGSGIEPQSTVRYSSSSPVESVTTARKPTVPTPG